MFLLHNYICKVIFMLSENFGDTRVIFGKHLDIFCLIATYYTFLEYTFKIYSRYFCFLLNACYITSNNALGNEGNHLWRPLGLLRFLQFRHSYRTK